MNNFFLLCLIVTFVTINASLTFKMDFKKSELYEILSEFKTDFKEAMTKVPESSITEMKTKVAAISTQQKQTYPLYSNQIYSHEGYMVTRKRTNERCGGGVRSIMGMGISTFSSMISGSSEACFAVPPPPQGGQQSLTPPPPMMGYATCSNIKAGAVGVNDYLYTEDSTEMGVLFFPNSATCKMVNECDFENLSCMYMPIQKEPKCRPYGKNLNKGFGTTCSDKPDYYNQIQGYFKLGAVLMKGYMSEDQCMYNVDQAQIFMISPNPNKCERAWPKEGMPFGCPEGVECYMKQGCDSDTQEIKIGFWDEDKNCKGRPDSVHSMAFQDMAAEMIGIEHCVSNPEMNGMAVRFSCMN